ncbi:MAG TPA: hypothetical protein VGC97_23480 [Pyrinomonadaceae bacterium]|jgi:hypothetical protein
MLEFDKKNEFVKSVFDYIEGGEITNAVNIFRKLEKKHRILFSSITGFSKGEFSDDIWIEKKLYPFLSDSQLIIAGDVIDNIEIYNADFQQFSATWRYWGEILANWCNENGIEKPLIGRNKSTRWKYLDFYMDSYASQWIQDYNEWAKAISEIILEKDKIFGSEYKAINE